MSSTAEEGARKVLDNNNEDNFRALRKLNDKVNEIVAKWADRYRNDDEQIKVKEENRPKDRKEANQRDEDRVIELKDSLIGDSRRNRNSYTRDGGRRGRASYTNTRHL